MNLQETYLDGETLFDGGFVAIRRDRVQLPNGNTTTRVVVRHPGAACVLAVTPDQRAVLVRNGVTPPDRPCWKCRPANWTQAKTRPCAPCANWRKKRRIAPTA